MNVSILNCILENTLLPLLEDLAWVSILELPSHQADHSKWLDSDNGVLAIAAFSVFTKENLSVVYWIEEKGCP